MRFLIDRKHYQIKESFMFNEFKKFAMRGNVVDMAIGIVIGAAFSAIVKSMVDDVLMPPIGLLLGGVDFSDFFIVLKEGIKAAAPYHTLADAKAAADAAKNAKAKMTRFRLECSIAAADTNQLSLTI